MSNRSSEWLNKRFVCHHRRKSDLTGNRKPKINAFIRPNEAKDLIQSEELARNTLWAQKLDLCFCYYLLAVWISNEFKNVLFINQNAVAWFIPYALHVCELKIGVRMIVLCYLKLRNSNAFPREPHSHIHHVHRLERNSVAWMYRNIYLHRPPHLANINHIIYGNWTQLFVNVQRISWNWADWGTGSVWRLRQESFESNNGLWHLLTLLPIFVLAIWK